jgi:hypothetical protein
MRLKAQLLQGDVEAARQALGKHVERLVLTLKSTPEGPILEVAGNVEIFNATRMGRVCVSVMMARDGIEPPTLAFSGSL